MVLLPAAVRGSGGLSILGARRRGGHGPPTALGPLGSALAGGPVFGAGGRASSGAGSISLFPPGIAPSLVLGLFAWCHRSRSLCSIMLGPDHVFHVMVVDNELVQVLIQS